MNRTYGSTTSAQNFGSAGFSSSPTAMPASTSTISIPEVTRSITSIENICDTGIGYACSLRKSSDAPVAAISSGTTCQYSSTISSAPGSAV